MKTPIEHWHDGALSFFPPLRTVATIEAQCNLSCHHCYWAHDMKHSSINDWKPAVERIKALRTPLLYAGRLLTKAGSSFLSTCVERIPGLSLGIIDNGYTILNYPEFLPRYEHINISIDGFEKAHDMQRNKVGSFRKAWETVLEMKTQGFDPIIASAFSPFSFEGWDRFEHLLAEHDVPISATLVWDLPEPAKRATATFQEKTLMVDAFRTLLEGVPKIINIYSIKHAVALTNILSEFTWNLDTDAGDCMTATVPSGTVIVYRPASVVAIAEVALRWDGRFYTTNSYSANTEYDLVSKQWLRELNIHVRKEREIWQSILERR
jgi:hypothetical protein